MCMKTKKPVSLYIHYPFCVRKCAYCDFLSAPADSKVRAEYVRALIREMRSVREDERISGRPVDTVFFGGGTPTLMEAEEFRLLMDGIRQLFPLDPNAEITAECNPGTAGFRKLAAMRECGINRLSVGVQSFTDSELKLLGRIHTAAEAKECILAARSAGFDNISMDLMSAIPGQSTETLTESLKAAVSLSPEHLSVYGLIIEEGTPFYDRYAGSPPVDEDTDREMYALTGEFLSENGFGRYEISNYALPGRECRHNTGYWTGHDYLGIGTGAASLIDHTRFSNTSSLSLYLDPDRQGEIRGEEVRLTRNDRISEFMFLGLRMTEGISEAEFLSRFGEEIDNVFGSELAKYAGLGFILRDGGRIRLSPGGIDISNTIMADFMLE